MLILKNILEVVTSPKEFFNDKKEKGNLLKLSEAFIVLIIINAIMFLLMKPLELTFFYLLKFICFGILGIFLWFIVGSFFEFVAKIYNQSGKLKQIMYCIAYSLSPLILFCPIHLLKYNGPIGYFISVVLSFIIYGWSIYLNAKAIELIYDLSFSRAIMLIFLPVVCSFFSIFWLIEFFLKTSYIFKGI